MRGRFFCGYMERTLANHHRGEMSYFLSRKKVQIPYPLARRLEVSPSSTSLYTFSLDFSSSSSDFFCLRWSSSGSIYVGARIFDVGSGSVHRNIHSQFQVHNWQLLEIFPLFSVVPLILIICGGMIFPPECFAFANFLVLFDNVLLLGYSITNFSGL